MNPQYPVHTRHDIPDPAHLLQHRRPAAVLPDNNTRINMNEPFLDWFESVLSEPIIPQTITTSYNESEQTVPLDYATSATCSHGSAPAVSASSPRAATSASAVGTAWPTTALAQSSSSPSSPHPIRAAHCTQAQVHVAHHTNTLSQVPGSFASAALRLTSPRTQRVSPVAVSRTIFRFHTISMTWCPHLGKISRPISWPLQVRSLP